MNQDIAKGDDALIVGNLCGGSRIELAQLRQSLTDDFELALHRGLEQLVGLIMSLGFPRRKCVNATSRLADIEQILLDLTRHKLDFWTLLPPQESTDS